MIDREGQLRHIVDGVYFNPLEGVAGTSWPIGTPSMPVNNFADAMTLMFARNLKKLYLVGARNFEGTHTAGNHPTIMTDANAMPFKPDSLIGLTIVNTNDGSSGVITDNEEQTIAVAALAGGVNNIWTVGDGYYVADVLDADDIYQYRITFDQRVDLELVSNGWYDIIVADDIAVNFINGIVCRNLVNTTGAITIWGNCYAASLRNTTGSIYITGDCHVESSIVQEGDGEIYIGGNLQTSSDVRKSAGSIQVYGDCRIYGDLSNDLGSFSIWGNCYVGELLENNSGTINIIGDCHVGTNLKQLGAGAIRIYGNCRVGNGLSNYLSIAQCTIQFTGLAPIMDLLLSANSETQRIVSRGPLTVSRMVAGATAIIDLCGGILTIAASCTGGTIDLYGDCGLNDLSGGAVTVNDNRIPGHL